MRKIGTQRQLLLDDFIVEDLWALKRTLHQPTKHPQNPLMVKEYEWEGQGPYLYGTVLFDEEEKLYKMWYQGYEPDHGYRACYAISKDGLSWEKPRLGIVEFNGSKDNNLILSGTASIHTPTVIKESKERDPARRYKMVYLSRVADDRDGICVAFSADGIHWTPYEGNPVILGHSDTHNVVVWDERLGKYVLYMRPNLYAGPSKRRVARAESSDFLHWSEPSTVLIPDELDPPEFYGMPVFIYEGVYFGFLQMYYTDTQTIDIQLAFSRDEVYWQRLLPRQPFLPLGPQGSFDSHMIFTASHPVVVNDQIWIYYSGWNNRHDVLERDAAIGLATLRLDGFISMDASENEGILLTRPFLNEGNQLRINAEAPTGSVAVEILYKDGEVVRGYEKDNCNVFTGDELHHTVTWKNKPDFNHLRNKLIRLKFYLKQAKLYSFQCVLFSHS